MQKNILADFILCYIQNKSVVPYTGSHIIDIDLVYVNINLKVFCHFIHLKLLLKQLCLLTSYYVRSLSQVQCDNLIVQRHQLALSLCQTGRSTDSYQSGAYKQQQLKIMSFAGYISIIIYVSFDLYQHLEHLLQCQFTFKDKHIYELNLTHI